MAMTIHKNNTLLYNNPVCKEGKLLLDMSLVSSIYIGNPIFQPPSPKISRHLILFY